MLTLAEIRREYAPKIPPLLENPKNIVFKEIKGSAVSKQVSPLFPLTSGFSSFVGAPGKATLRPLRVGVVFSGGPAAGGHNVIWGLLDMLEKGGDSHELVGFLGGPGALVTGAHRKLSSADIAPFRNQGGFDLLGSGRKKIETSEQFEAVLNTVSTLKLDGLIIIGGDDSNTNAANLAEYFWIKQHFFCKI